MVKNYIPPNTDLKYWDEENRDFLRLHVVAVKNVFDIATPPHLTSCFTVSSTNMSSLLR